MYVYVCICMCMYVYVCVCMSMYVCMGWMDGCMYVCTNVPWDITVVSLRYFYDNIVINSIQSLKNYGHYVLLYCHI